MIADAIQNKKLYAGISPGLALALDYVETVKADDFTVQTIEVDGRQVYAMNQSYITEPAEGRQYEAHRRYIDVQYIVEGEEVIRAAELSGMESRSAYDAEKDIQWFMPASVEPAAGAGAVQGTDSGAVSVIHLKAGQFGIFFPRDAHMPKLAAGSPGAVKKVVVKVAV